MSNPTNKLFLFASTLAGVFAVISATLYVNSTGQSQRLDNLALKVDALTIAVEAKTLQQLQTQKQLESTENELAISQSQLLAINEKLRQANSKVDPDYNQVQEQLRKRLLAEIQSHSANKNYADFNGDKAQLIRSLSALPENEFASIIAIRSEFGGFLDSLNVSEERMSVVIGALDSMIQDRNTAMSQLMEQKMLALRDTLKRGETPDQSTRVTMQGDISSLHSLENQLETLAFDLTVDELASFETYQQQRQQNSGSFSRASIGTVGGGQAGSSAFIMNTESFVDSPAGSGDAMAIREIITSELFESGVLDAGNINVEIITIDDDDVN